MDVPSADELALRGAFILKHYRHPDDWRPGSDTSRIHLMRCRVLKVEEIRIGNPPPGFAANDPDQARLNARAIAAFARAVRLQPYQLLIDQQDGKAPYIYVPDEHWAVVLPLLQALRTE